ncbi:hypothetical protein ACIBI8_28935 [Streptomyces sp. NPDC050529]|uniref:hypothetical protein n=1 Tax=Streptomyces sp. NPDC050529 TaxID=3365624 RepID=UPI0037922330
MTEHGDSREPGDGTQDEEFWGAADDEDAGAAGFPPGGISIGMMAGGAAATGARALAEDRGRRVGNSATRVHPPGNAVTPPVVPGGIGIGAMTGGAVASGSDARAVDSSWELVDVSPELFAAVTALRGHLGVLTRTEEVAELDEGLAEVEGATAGSGRVPRDRLDRLRERLELGATAAAGLTSASAVLQAIAQLSG